MKEQIEFHNTYKIECHTPEGDLRWVEEVHNIVVNTGLDDVLTRYFKGSAYTAAHYVGITAGSPTFAAGNTMASHAGWTENTGYAESTRPALTLGTVSGQSVNNSSNKAVFTLNADATVGGAFITTNNTKGGTTGTLYGGAAFSSGNRSALDGDTISVTVTLTAATA